MVTLHARLREGADPAAAVVAIKARLATLFGVQHATIETERGECADGQFDFDPDLSQLELTCRSPRSWPRGRPVAATGL